MRLTRVDDPRDNLERADRDQLFRFAKSRGVKEIDDRVYNGGNAANMMRLILRQKGMTDISVPQHQLGMPPHRPMEEQPSGQPAMMLDDLLKQQLKEVLADSEKPAEPVKPISGMSFQDMRKECKARGIYFARTDNMLKLREKLNGQAAP